MQQFTKSDGIYGLRGALAIDPFGPLLTNTISRPLWK